MAYMSNDSGYGGSGVSYGAAEADTSVTYSSGVSRRKMRFIGCTCANRGPCRATCRMPVPE